jgi:hypothetical protein
MSETSIFPGVGTPTDQGIGMVPPDGDGDETGGAGRRRVMIIGAIVGVVLVVIVAYLLLHKSSSTPATATPPVSSLTSSAPTTTGGGAGQTHTKAHTKVPKLAKQPAVRDPFTALITQPVAGAANPVSTSNVTAPPAPSTSQSAAPTTVSSTAPVVVISTPPVTTSSAPTITPGVPQWIQLMSVHGNTATFDVGYANHKFRRFAVAAPKPTATTGTAFDKEFELIGITAGTPTVQVGDGTPFDMKTGVSYPV